MKTPAFNYRYFLLAFAMFNWEAPKGLNMQQPEIRLASTAFKP